MGSTSTFNFTPDPKESLPGIWKELNDSFQSRKTSRFEWRKEQLRSYWRMIDENEEAIRNAIFADIGKPLVQSQVMEIIATKNDIVNMMNNLDGWLGVEKVDVPPPFENWSPVIHRRPKGICLVIGAWNYPITLTLMPFIGVIACGNTGILKPSELAPHTAMLLASLFPKYLDPTCFRVVNGDKEIAKALIFHPYGHIVFTGSTAVGKEVMAAAAKTLSPVTLELGGKNCVLLTENADIELAAKRISWGKFAIAGQTCFAPNYAIVQESAYEDFIEALERTYKEFYQGKADIAKVGHIVNHVHWKRIMSLLESTKGKTVFGATGNEETLFISPTAIKDLSPSDPLLQTEIFGPILPILKYSTPANAKSLLNTFSPTTLGLYVFSSSLEQAHDILTWVQAGSAAINDVMAQIAPTSLPFGGVGQSGFGAYRGKASIDTFSHRQSVVTVPAVPQFEAMLGWRYPMVEGMGTVEFVKKNLEVKL